MTLYQRIKKRTFEIIGPTKKGDVASTIFDILICFVIILSAVSIGLELFGVTGILSKIIIIFEYSAVILFIIEYLLRIWTADLEFPECPNKLQAIKEFVTSFESLIDLISIFSVLLNSIPKDLAFLRLLKLLKLVRLIKMNDYIQNILPDEEKPKRFQKRIYEIISKDTTGDKLSKIYDIVSIILILTSVSFLITDTFELNQALHNTLMIMEIVIACLFALEYVVRVWTAPFEFPNLRPDKARMHYIFSFMAIIDLLSIVPVFFVNLPNTTGILKLFKLCKILRLVKASRYLNGIATLGKAIQMKKKQITLSLVALAILIILCSLLLYSFEHDAQPDVYKNGFSGIFHGFSSIALENSDSMEPITPIGKVLSTLMTLIGTCIIGVPIAIIADGFGIMIKIQAEGKNEQQNKVKEVSELYESLTSEEKEKFLDKLKEN